MKKNQTNICGLAYWMEQTARRYWLALEDPSVTAIHDLRTAMRRCLSLTSGLLTVHEEPLFFEINKSVKPVFKKLGLLRDIHVLSFFQNSGFP